MAEVQAKSKTSRNISEFKPCYMFVSKSHSILDEKIDSLKKLLRNQINMETDFKVFYGGEEINEQEFLNYCNTPSFFSIKKVAVIKNFEKVSASFQESLFGILNTSDTATLPAIFIITASKIPRISREKSAGEKEDSAKKTKVFSLQKLLSRISDIGIIENISSPSQDSIRKWLYGRSELDGLSFTAKAVSRFIENVNFDINLLKKEYEKIFLYMASEKEKTVDEITVNKLVNRVFEMKIFDMVDFIGRRDKRAAISALKSVIEDRKKPGSFSQGDKNIVGVLTLIHRMFKAFLYLNSTGSKELLKNYIDRHIGHVPYMAGIVSKNYALFSKNYSIPEITGVFDILNDYDIKLRTAHERIIPGLAMKLISDITDIKA